MRTHAFSRKRALMPHIVYRWEAERQGLEREELYVNLGCLRERAQVAGV